MIIDPPGLPFVAAPPRLIEEDVAAAAAEIGCDPTVIQAVLKVETAGGGLLPDGRPKILFEAHWFGRYTRGRYNDSHPRISAPKWTRGLYRGGAAEYDRLAEAMQLDRPAALQSASWGLGQIMGGNFREAGFPDIEAFVAAMCASERAQLLAMVRFIRAKGLDDELRDQRWADFADVYNGPGYAVHGYHTKLASTWVALRQASQESRGLPARNALPALPVERRAIAELQAALTLRGFNVTVDGFAGPKTRAAVIAFQRSQGLNPDGIPGPVTRRALGL